MTKLKVGDVVYLDDDVRGTIIDIDRRPGYGRVIIDTPALSIENTRNGKTYRGKAAEDLKQVE